MARNSNAHRPQPIQQPESRRTDRPLFFDEFAESGAYLEVPISTQLPSIDLINGHTHRALRKHFKQRVWHNEAGLSLAFVNKHDASHMDRVATGVFHLGTLLGLDPNDVATATLATRFHDVGYEFPEGADLAVIERMGKDLHSAHASRGATLVVDHIRHLIATDTSVAQELEGWNDNSFHIAQHAIQLHSNDVGTDDSAASISLLPRLIDKLDNRSSRVRTEHLDAFRTATFRTVGHIQQQVEKGIRRTLSSQVIPSSKRHRLSMDSVRQRLEATDQYYFHRLVPAAIEDQHLFLNPNDYTMLMQYRVYPTHVSSVLGAEYTNEDHLYDFRRAYSKSMVNAAGVIRSIRSNLLDEGATINQPLLDVHLIYEDGRQITLHYSSTQELV